MANSKNDEQTPNGGTVVKITFDSDTEWVAVPGNYVGVELRVTTGSATVEQTSATPNDYKVAGFNGVAWDKGAVGAGQVASSVVVGASAVRAKISGSTSGILYVRQP
jgi:hypothetical protein